MSLMALDKESMKIEMEKKMNEGVVFFCGEEVWAKFRL